MKQRRSKEGKRKERCLQAILVRSPILSLSCRSSRFLSSGPVAVMKGRAAGKHCSTLQTFPPLCTEVELLNLWVLGPDSWPDENQHTSWFKLEVD